MGIHPKGLGSSGAAGGMGSSISEPVRSQDSPSGVMSLSFHQGGRLRLLNGTQQAVNEITSLVSMFKRREVSYTNFGGSAQWLLGPSYFTETSWNYGNGVLDAVRDRQLVLAVLQAMHAVGCQLRVCTDLSREARSMSTMLFETRHAECPPCALFALCPVNKKQMAIVPSRGTDMGSHDMCLLAHCVRNATNYIVEEKVIAGALLIEFSEPYWYADGTLAIELRMFMCRLLQNLRQNGFVFHCSADLSWSNVKDVSTMFVRKVASEITSQFACISLSMSDRLRIIGTSSNDTINAVRMAVDKNWGSHNCRQFVGATELILAGAPWNSHGKSNVIKSRVLLGRVLEAMAAHGWTLTATITLTKKLRGKSSFFFQRTLPEGTAYPIACISLNSMATLRLINAPPDLEENVKRALQLGWKPGYIARPKRTNPDLEQNTCREYCLSGSPWLAQGLETVHTRSLMSHVLKACQLSGWSVVSSAYVSSVVRGNEVDGYREDVHSWFIASDIPIAACLPEAVPEPNPVDEFIPQAQVIYDQHEYTAGVNV
eukprot:CAMPEP_0203784498 /NCGR_PEP_ID=MMETSP0100_2-20121128/497_1 /ASSEMBLY_ACC=CAM_ASM_000210 /TAXON_ID=96639 /ORGANISM=" , Strain NY0313808BC1" /LENGTH=542 /DNA_ID=CAMNT_0050686481 /DNA_START=599 /DNA_END=2222 /DNA_ORIENTATION=-